MILCNLLQELHHLLARLTVQGTRRLIGEQNGRPVHKRPCDGNTLHLPAGELQGLLVCLFRQAYALERIKSPLPSLLPLHAGERHRELHVCENRLVGDQVVALEDKPDGVVAVGVPVPLFVAAGRCSAESHLAGIVSVQAADDVQQRRLPRTADPFHRYELTFPE